MKKAILGTKVGMTQMFREDGTMIPVTVVLAGPCPVVQKKTGDEGNTVVLITHDNSIAVKARRIVRLQDGRIIYDGDAHDPRAVVQPEDEAAAGEAREVLNV